MKRILSFFWRSASMMPLMPSPGMPKMTSTPQSNNDSTRTSDAFMAQISPAKCDCCARVKDATLLRPIKMLSNYKSGLPNLLAYKKCRQKTEDYNSSFNSAVKFSLQFLRVASLTRAQQSHLAGEICAMNASEVLVESLLDWGVEVIFGIPGDGINGIIEALRQKKDKIRFIQVRHEEAAAFAACGYAKVTGKLGVCIATSGPGGIHLLNGLYDAKLDQAPVLAITGLQFSDLIGTFTQQDVELDKLFMDCCVYNERIMSPTHVENVMELACRTALAYRGVAHVTVPVDVQEGKVGKPYRSKRNIASHVSDVMARGAHMPSEADLHKAAEILNQGEKVAILAGAGAIHATDELEKAAEMLGGFFE